MKSKTFTLFLFINLLFVSFLLPSCGKDKEVASSAPTKTELIASSTWKYSGATVGGSDVSAFLQSCQKDNTMLFATAGTGTLDEGATKCNVSDPQTAAFTWNYDSGETTLHVSAILFTGGSSDFNLVSVSANQLILSQIITVGGSPQNAVVTFTH